MDLTTNVESLTLTDEQIAGVRALIATQPDADMLADALGVA